MYDPAQHPSYVRYLLLPRVNYHGRRKNSTHTEFFPNNQLLCGEPRVRAPNTYYLLIFCVTGDSVAKKWNALKKGWSAIVDFHQKKKREKLNSNNPQVIAHQ